MQGLELCPWFSPDGAGVWSQQGLWDEQPPKVAVFRCCYPPPRSPLSLGPLGPLLALVAYASRAEPGSYRGEVVNGPKCWTYKPSYAGVKVGARIAPNAFASAV